MDQNSGPQPTQQQYAQQAPYNAQPVQQEYGQQAAYNAQPVQQEYGQQAAYNAQPVQQEYGQQAAYNAQPAQQEPAYNGSWGNTAHNNGTEGYGLLAGTDLWGKRTNKNPEWCLALEPIRPKIWFTCHILPLMTKFDLYNALQGIAWFIVGLCWIIVIYDPGL